jgi:glucokinase
MTAPDPRAVRDDSPALVADIGGTNARFALLAPDGTVSETRILHCADHPGLDAAAEAYLAAVAPPVRPRRAAVAVAGPVSGDWFELTNHGWRFSVRAVAERLGLARLDLVNDFSAVALALPHLGPDDRRQVGPGTAQAGHPIAVLGPGSGLGVGGVVPAGAGWVALATEGGHVTMAAADDREAAVLGDLRRRFGHVSAERVVSGMGLPNLHRALAAVDGAETPDLDAAAISEAALAGTDPRCVEALTMFCAMLGTVAGNLALSLGAQGGVYVAGGIVPRLGDWFDRSPFRARFEAKGRMSAYLAPIPTHVVTHPLPAFVGLAAAIAAGRRIQDDAPHDP